MPEQESFSAEVAGQKVAINVSNLNTFATIAGMSLSLVTAVMMYGHIVDAKELTNALKEMTIAIREQNCLNTVPVERRGTDPEFCKRLSR